ncbi:4701_t:CDS:2, partial [Cetraspora pellucida]
TGYDTVYGHHLKNKIKIIELSSISDRLLKSVCNRFRLFKGP